jgi:hypothetical protein
VLLQAVGCYLADYRTLVGVHTARVSCVPETSRCSIQGHGNVISCLWMTILGATTLAPLLVRGAVEISPGRGMETENHAGIM